MDIRVFTNQMITIPLPILIIIIIPLNFVTSLVRCLLRRQKVFCFDKGFCIPQFNMLHQKTCFSMLKKEGEDLRICPFKAMQ